MLSRGYEFCHRHYIQSGGRTATTHASSDYKTDRDKPAKVAHQLALETLFGEGYPADTATFWPDITFGQSHCHQFRGQLQPGLARDKIEAAYQKPKNVAALPSTDACAKVKGETRRNVWESVGTAFGERIIPHKHFDVTDDGDTLENAVFGAYPGDDEEALKMIEALLGTLQDPEDLATALETGADGGFISKRLKTAATSPKDGDKLVRLGYLSLDA